MVDDEYDEYIPKSSKLNYTCCDICENLEICNNGKGYCSDANAFYGEPLTLTTATCNPCYNCPAKSPGFKRKSDEQIMLDVI